MITAVKSIPAWSGESMTLSQDGLPVRGAFSMALGLLARSRASQGGKGLQGVGPGCILPVERTKLHHHLLDEPALQTWIFSPLLWNLSNLSIASIPF